MVLQQLTTYLDNAHVNYQIHTHELAFTAQEIAERSHINGMSFAKTVIVRADGQLTMLVMPAPYNIDFDNIAEAMQCQSVQLAFEYEFEDEFPDCERGAMPPFGNLFHMPVFIAEDLTKQDHIYFNAGDHRDLVELAFSDFQQLVKGTILKGGLLRSGIPPEHLHARRGRVKH